MNRGSDRVDRGITPGFRASMRPRFMNRGSERSLADEQALKQCFNEAPIHESGKSDTIRRADRAAIKLQ